MVYITQVFFMLDERVDMENNFELGKKLRAWISAQDINGWFKSGRDSFFEEQPFLNQQSTPGKGFLPEDEGLGFFLKSTKWYRSNEAVAWITNLMDFMDSQGLKERYYFTKVPTNKCLGCEDIAARGHLEPVNQTISVKINFTP